MSIFHKEGMRKGRKSQLYKLFPYKNTIKAVQARTRDQFYTALFGSLEEPLKIFWSVITSMLSIIVSMEKLQSFTMVILN